MSAEHRVGSSYPFVSVIVVNWNGKGRVEACVESCRRLSYPNYEVIVVDNGSTDGSAEIVEVSFPDVHLIRIGRNIGFARASNKGILAAKGEYIAILANDIRVDSMWLSCLLNELVKSSDSGGGCVGVAGGLIYFQDAPELIWGGGGFIDWLTGSMWHPHAYEKSVEIASDVDFVSGGATLIKREVFDRIGLLDEDYYLYSEDVDFCVQARRAGFNVRSVPGAKSWHMTPIQQTWSQRGYYLGVCSRIRFYFKNSPFRYMFPTLIFQLVSRPIFEVLWFGANPRFLLLNARALAMNLNRLRGIFLARRTVERLGKCRTHFRTGGFIVTALDTLRGAKSYRW